MGGKQVLWFAVFAVLFGVVAGYQLLHYNDLDTSLAAAPPSQHVEIGGQQLDVYVADTPAKQELGLSGREGLGFNEGMLFVFEKDDEYAFWMKDMKFAIDIIWIDASGKVVHIEPNLTPDTYPHTYRPDVPARFVLEVNAGFVERNNVQVGSMMYVGQ
ncbi:DUF192 domain-containing protein [Candidatus Parcubacteria bacterium]|nr:MAG: DUF192 domain-containing protein [Candidatus Parcubacteria bacterium]